MVSAIIDRALDWTVLPGYSRIGYSIRRRSWPRRNARLDGWGVMITGASSGIGAAATEQLARAGATVHMVVRNRDKGEDARAGISERTGSDRVHLQLCDVSNLAAVRELA